MITLSNGIATATAATLTAKGELLSDFTEQFTIHDLSHHKLFSFRLDRILPRVSCFNATVASLIADGQSNYYHWLFDVLPRLHLIQQAKIHPDFYYIESALAFQKASIRQLGIDERKLIDPSKNPYISASSLIVPSFLCLHDLPNWVCDFLKGAFIKEKPIRELKIYVSRKNAKHRRIINEDAIESFLIKKGFKIVLLENLSFEEQVRLFSSAKEIVSPHGAGLANLAFCFPNTKIIEIFSPRFPCVCFWKLSNLLKLDYCYVKGEMDLQTFSPINPGYDDIVLNMEKFERTCALIGI